MMYSVNEGKAVDVIYLAFSEVFTPFPTSFMEP